MDCSTKEQAGHRDHEDVLCKGKGGTVLEIILAKAWHTPVHMQKVGPPDETGTCWHDAACGTLVRSICLLFDSGCCPRGHIHFDGQFELQKKILGNPNLHNIRFFMLEKPKIPTRGPLWNFYPLHTPI